MPRASTAGAAARKPLPDVCCHFLSGQRPYLESGTQIGTPWYEARDEGRPVQRVEPRSREQSAKLGDRTVCRGPRIGLQRPA